MGAWAAKLWRRLLVLLIGGVIAVPYIAVIIWAVTAWNQVSDRALALGILAFSAVVFILLCIPAFLAVIRALERTLAEQLLELSIPTPPRRPTWSDRLRGALFYFGHAFAGALLLVTVVVVLPSVLLMVADPQQVSELSNGVLGIAGTPEGSTAGNAGLPSGTGPEPVLVLSAGLIQILAPVLLLLLAAFIIAEGYFLPHYSQILLGPSAADRAALAGADRVRRFRRTVLAREVHDSIGHALTVTTMQAAVAKRALHQDQKLAETAVDEIARTSREAVAELDHVLALLRAEVDSAGSEESTVGDADALDGADAIDGADGEVLEGRGRAGDGDSGSARPPRRTMLDITRLAEEARAIGHPTRLTVSGDAAGLPPTVVHELHRIVREAVTNSLRHAAMPGIDVAIDVGADCVQVLTRNAGAATGPVLDLSKKGRTVGKAATDEKVAGAAKGSTDAKGMAASARESRGLIGISERAALFGGNADWGVENGQWILQVRLPYSKGKTP